MTAPTAEPFDGMRHLAAFLDRAHPGWPDDRALHERARALSHAYTTGGAAGSRDVDVAGDAAASVAYLAHFGPRAIAAVRYALSFTTVPRDCVDVGAGSGASALALIERGARRLTLVDASAPALSLARRLLDGAGAGGCSVDTVVSELGRVKPVEHAQLALSAFAFGELSQQQQEPTAAFAQIERVAPKAGALVVVDAGDRARARRLQTLRDAIVSEGRLSVAAPCPHRDACPALIRERDWCHARIDKALPDAFARFARGVGRDDERMAASFLVIERAQQQQEQHGEASEALLVIGEPLKEKGRARLPVCGPRGVRFVQALKRDRAAFDALLAIPRGARLDVAVAGAGETRAGVAHCADAAALVPVSET